MCVENELKGHIQFIYHRFIIFREISISNLLKHFAQGSSINHDKCQI